MLKISPFSSPSSGATLTSLASPCEYMWMGIEVWGLPAAPSFISSVQGKVSMKNATISNAHLAVMAGRRIIAPRNTFVPNGSFDQTFSGGVIDAEDCNFVDNGISIKYISKSNGEAASSRIVNCDFTGTGPLLDPRYNWNITGHYPNPNNPHNGSHNGNLEGRHGVGIFQWHVRDITLQGNHFDNVNAGMVSFDAKFVVENSQTRNTDFNDLIWGIEMNNVLSNVDNRVEIKNCIFNNIPGSGGGQGVAIEASGGRNYIIRNNEFGDASTPQVNNFYGIRMRNTGNFEVLDNTFTKTRWTISVSSNKDRGGLIGPKNDPLGNKFFDSYVGTITTSDNSALIMRCNTYNSINAPAGEHVVNWLNSQNSVLADQGMIPLVAPTDPDYPRYPAGNEFFPPDRKKVFSLTNDYEYFRHSGGSTPTSVIPVDVQGFATIDVLSTGVEKVSTSCHPLIPPLPDPDPCTGSNPPCRLAPVDAIDAKVSSLQSAYSSMQQNLDQGNTLALLAAINSTIPNGQLKDLLVNNSPLSDAVLSAFINKTNPAPGGHFLQVLLMNSPVSKLVRPDLVNKLDTYSPGIRNQILDAQGANGGNVTLASIQRSIDGYKVIRQLTLNKIIENLVRRDLVQAAVNILELQTTIDAKQTLFCTYLSQDDLVSADDKLNGIPGASQDLIDWIDLNSELLDLEQNLQTLFEMSAYQEALIRSLAADVNGSLAASSAQAISRLVFNEDFPLVEPTIPPLPQAKLIGNSAEEEFGSGSAGLAMERNKSRLGNNFPNPFNGSTYIPYNLTRDKGKILVYDLIKGNLIESYDVLQGTNLVEFDSRRYASGTYIYELQVDSVVIDRRKMVLIR